MNYEQSGDRWGTDIGYRVLILGYYNPKSVISLFQGHQRKYYKKTYRISDISTMKIL